MSLMVMLTLTKDDTISGQSEKAWNYKAQLYSVHTAGLSRSSLNASSGN